MDKTDHALIAALRRNARASVSELAADLGVTRATVRARLDRLIERGDIVGFTVVTRGENAPLPVRGMMLIQIEGKGTNRVTEQLKGMAEVQVIHTTSGRWDLIIELGTQSLPELDSVLSRIRMIDGIRNSETNLYLSTKLSNRSQES